MQIAFPVWFITTTTTGRVKHGTEKKNYLPFPSISLRATIYGSKMCIILYHCKNYDDDDDDSEGSHGCSVKTGSVKNKLNWFFSLYRIFPPLFEHISLMGAKRQHFLIRYYSFKSEKSQKRLWEWG